MGRANDLVGDLIQIFFRFEIVGTIEDYTDLGLPF